MKPNGDINAPVGISTLSAKNKYLNACFNPFLS
jgi:hypothetical protein